MYTPNAIARYTVEFVIVRSNVDPNFSGIIPIISNCSNGDPAISFILFRIDGFRSSLLRPSSRKRYPMSVLSSAHLLLSVGLSLGVFRGSLGVFGGSASFGGFSVASFPVFSLSPFFVPSFVGEYAGGGGLTLSSLPGGPFLAFFAFPFSLSLPFLSLASTWGGWVSRGLSILI